MVGNQTSVQCSNVGELLDHIHKWRSAGHGIQLDDDPSMRTIGFQNFRTGERRHVQLTQMRRDWFNNDAHQDDIVKKFGLPLPALKKYMTHIDGRSELAGRVEEGASA